MTDISTLPHLAAVAEALRAKSRLYGDAAWKLDSALSAYRKSDPATGYRNNPALGDPPSEDREEALRAVASAAVEGFFLLNTGEAL